MKKQFIAAGFVLLSFMLPLKASAFTGIYVLGDSLSDTGNTFSAIEAETGIGLPPPPYFQGRFSNGPIWIDELAQKLNLDSPTPLIQVANGATPTSGINFAFGGATTTTANIINGNLFGLPQQLGAFQTLLNTNQQPVDPDALYILAFGSNDYVPTTSLDFVPFTNPDQTLANISNAVQALASFGVKNLLVPNLSNLGDTPLALSLGQSVSNNLNQLTQDHNAGLSTLIAGFNQNPALGLNIIPLDINSVFSNPQNLGFTNFTEPCLNINTQTLCNNPDEYLYWDFSHPTSPAHSLVADAAFLALEPQSVPEPGSILGMLALGALGAAGVLKRQQKKFAFTPANPALFAQSFHTKVEN
ncbi:MULTISPECIES: SGNH/GDSL hydrolase family protein [Cyanophyceae]|uniref:SGNH/GDSL hydrolase family protein n=1 Tax=Cyanophyceae TaxID=3028117 RepID=UPI00232DED61|nr:MULTISPECIES: SGNH/GDSL hydrolase family protein [Cyanophyceae]MDB9357586.1 SGNH/GDSL hydrolase family protein [Nodularia spumigena CS-587/03]MDB9321998.1 SGNH/GDSL hydrolase family protein [Nodularia spumigena CS-591/07A]MDB9329100.1 SGNH/GDSL hydrolase family protein [Nodularia spumigena CS-591/04]MDB9339862.1 SGNH/GDSL hydrolase family protein [Nodularia spumigena CS-589/07]MDB9344286.1 SGNH/GDSL hydrolase family protein [Nodularia spumigena CS-588/06]